MELGRGFPVSPEAVILLMPMNATVQEGETAENKKGVERFAAPIHFLRQYSSGFSHQSYLVALLQRNSPRR